LWKYLLIIYARKINFLQVYFSWGFGGVGDSGERELKFAKSLLNTGVLISL
jgi:hypothetical protein